ncbi:AMP-binding protein [Pseudorhodoferax sp.]|uniref:AMP-binding protein n=1 Tax=Pseudorhodoferax sp. TaxID=1993553 RepID=UPI002DD66577|nr:AMP-binding protein [Pseudorhodoferax sp.]
MRVLRTLNVADSDLTFHRLLQRQVERNADKTYLVHEGGRWSYRALYDETAWLAQRLLDLGIRPGEHVAILADNSAPLLFLHFACGVVGAVTCPVNTAVKADLLVYYLTLSNASTVVCSAALRPRLEEVLGKLPQLRRVLMLDTEPGQPEPDAAAGVRWDRIGARGGAHAAMPDLGVSPAALRGLSFTSGTTGPSKAIAASNAALWKFCMGRVQYLGLYEDDVAYTCLPLFHGNALATACFAAFIADASVVLSRRFSASRFWQEVRDHGVTQFNLLSSMSNILWGQAPSELDRAHRARICTMAPMPSFGAAFAERFRIEVVSSYALSDFGQVSFLQPGFPASKLRSTGRPRPGIQVQIQDDDGHPLAVRQPGEICLRADDSDLGPRSYYNDPGNNARANQNGWFHTGDRGYLDEDGYLFFVDRKKDAIRRRGENISSWEVEQVIAEHPAVAEVAVFPVHSGMSEDEVMAAIVCRQGMQVAPAEIVAFCDARMSYFMVPRFIEFTDAFPRTPTEKVQKQALIAAANGRLDEIWDRERAGIVLTR